MELELRFSMALREAVSQKPIYWRVDGDATIGDILRSLETEYDDLAGRLIEGGEVKPHVNVLKDGHEVVHFDGIATTLDNGDAVSAFPSVAGG